MRVSRDDWSVYERTQLRYDGRYTFAIGIASAAIYSVLEPIEKATGLTLGDLNAGTGYMVRCLPSVARKD